MKKIWQLWKSVILNLVHKTVQNFSIWCAFTCLMRQNSSFDSIQKLLFWKVPKIRLKSVLFSKVAAIKNAFKRQNRCDKFWKRRACFIILFVHSNLGLFLTTDCSDSLGLFQNFNSFHFPKPKISMLVFWFISKLILFCWKGIISKPWKDHAYLSDSNIFF